MTINNKLHGQTTIATGGTFVAYGTATFQQDVTIDGSLHSNGTAVTPGGAGITLTDTVRPLNRARINLSAVVVAVTAVLDYGSVLIATFPNSSIMLVGAVMDLAATEDGVGITDVSTIDFALGSVPVASTTFVNAGEQDVIAEGDVTAGGLMEGASTDTEDSQFLAPSATNEIYVNVQSTISVDGSVTLTGYVDLFYHDLGAPDGV